MKSMGDAAGVPIEPPEQTKILNQLQAINGVIGTGIPGGSYLV
jgi:phosphomevalonate kinase